MDFVELYTMQGEFNCDLTKMADDTCYLSLNNGDEGNDFEGDGTMGYIVVVKHLPYLI